MANEPMRRYVFRPYVAGMGPHFILKTWDTDKRDALGKNVIRYSLVMREHGKSVTLFAAEDFACSPMHAIDSVAAAHDLMGFLTLRPGDTDDEYFANYSETQRAYCSQHAEALAGDVMRRWTDANGNLRKRFR